MRLHPLCDWLKRYDEFLILQVQFKFWELEEFNLQIDNGKSDAKMG